MHVFEVPAGFHQFTSQPIKQFRVTGGDALGTEIIFGLNDANPEILLPQSIHQDPGCQWILFRNDPSSQIQTIGDSLLDQRVQD